MRAALLLALAGCGASAAGTTVTSDDGLVTLLVPASAGVDASLIRIRARTDLAALPDAVFAYDLEPDGLRFATPARLTWQGPLSGLGATLTTPDLAWLDLPLTVLQSYHDDADPAPQALADQTLDLDLDAQRGTLSGALSHFSGVRAEPPDHEKFAGHFAVGFMGLQTLPASGAAAPVVGMRYWINKQIGLDVGLGFSTTLDSVTVDGAPATSALVGTSVSVDNVGDEARFDPPGVISNLGFALHGGVPIDFAVGKHYKFQLVPELNFGVAVHKTLRPGSACPSSSFDINALMALGLHFGLPESAICGVTPRPTGPTVFSTGAMSKVPEPSTNISASGANAWRLTTDSMAALYYFSVFHCGDGPGVAFTVCPSPAATPPPGDVLLFSQVLGDAVSLADPVNRYIYAFVLDADGDPSNNYRAPVNYPKDFYDDTDRWYEASYVPGAGWTLTAKDAHGPTPTAVATSARLMIQGNAIMLMVPAGEVAVAKPRWRATAFRHKGDYGLAPPYDWSGDVEPPVGTLADTP